MQAYIMECVPPMKRHISYISIFTLIVLFIELNLWKLWRKKYFQRSTPWWQNLLALTSLRFLQRFWHIQHRVSKDRIGQQHRNPKKRRLYITGYISTGVDETLTETFWQLPLRALQFLLIWPKKVTQTSLKYSFWY